MAPLFKKCIGVVISINSLFFFWIRLESSCIDSQHWKWIHLAQDSD